MIVLMLLFAGLTSCNHHKQDNKEHTVKSKVLSEVLPQREVSSVVGIGLVEPKGLITKLALKSAGTINRIYKYGGDTVKAGQIILTLDDKANQLNLEKLKFQEKVKHYNLQSDSLAIVKAKLNLEDKTQKLGRDLDLVKQGAVTRESVDNLKLNVQNLKLDLQKQKSDFAAAKQQMGELKIQMAQAKLDIQDKILRAPVDGTILQVVHPEFSSIQPYESLVKFAPAGPVIVRCEVDEMFADYIKPGQPVDIRNVGFGKIIARGKVLEALPYMKEKSLFIDNPSDKRDRRVREVRIVVFNPKGLLFNGRVECTIHINK